MTPSHKNQEVSNWIFFHRDEKTILYWNFHYICWLCGSVYLSFELLLNISFPWIVLFNWHGSGVVHSYLSIVHYSIITLFSLHSLMHYCFIMFIIDLFSDNKGKSKIEIFFIFLVLLSHLFMCCRKSCLIFTMHWTEMSTKIIILCAFFADMEHIILFRLLIILRLKISTEDWLDGIIFKL